MQNQTRNKEELLKKLKPYFKIAASIIPQFEKIAPARDKEKTDSYWLLHHRFVHAVSKVRRDISQDQNPSNIRPYLDDKIKEIKDFEEEAGSHLLKDKAPSKVLEEVSLIIGNHTQPSSRL